jgi:cell volume regulation protein A
MDHDRVISTLGVLITAAITGVAAYYTLGVPLIVAMLLGASIASTDPTHAGADLPSDPCARPRGTNDRQRVGIQRRHRSSHNVCGVVRSNGYWAVLDGNRWLGDFFFQSGVGMLSGAALGYAAAVAIGHKQYDS